MSKCFAHFELSQNLIFFAKNNTFYLIKNTIIFVGENTPLGSIPFLIENDLKTNFHKTISIILIKQKIPYYFKSD